MRRLEITPEEAAAELLRRRFARKSMLGFTCFTKPDYQVNWHHRLLCAVCDDLVEGRSLRGLVFQPPRTGKSEIVSRRLPPYWLGRNPDSEVIGTSYSADLAHRMSRDVQRVMESIEYTQLFGSLLPVKGTSARARRSDYFELVEPHHGRYRAAGVGGGITGMGMSLGIVDDPVKDRMQANSPRVRDAVWEWFTSTFMTRAAKDCRVLVTMTRWHRDDLAGRLMRLAETDPKADQWQVLCLPAVLDRPREGDPRQLGEALWPERFPLSRLEKTKAASLGDWFALYQQDPTAEGGSEWGDDYFGPSIYFDEWPSDIVMRVTTLDPSKGRTDRSDYSAIIDAGLAADGTIYVDADLSRRSTSRIVEDLLGHVRAWVPSVVDVETNQYQELLADEVLRQASLQGLPVPVRYVENTLPKITRIRRLGPFLGNGLIKFRAESPGTRLLVEQLREFPNGAHDDGPDALDMAVQAIYSLIGQQQHNDSLAGAATLGWS